MNRQYDPSQLFSHFTSLATGLTALICSGTGRNLPRVPSSPSHPSSVSSLPVPEGRVTEGSGTGRETEEVGKM